MPGFYTPTGAHTAVEHGSIPIRYKAGGASEGVAVPGNKKEAREWGGRRYLLEEAIKGDVAFVRAWKVDEVGNCVFRYTQNNFSSVMARNAALTIVEAENIVPIGAISPNAIHLPGVYVDRIVKATAPKQIEFATLAQDADEASGKGSEAVAGEKAAKAARHRIAKRAAKELQDGFHVNLGIGMPTLVPEVCPAWLLELYVGDVRADSRAVVPPARGEGLAAERERNPGNGAISDRKPVGPVSSMTLARVDVH